MMEKNHVNLESFVTRFNTEEACTDYLFQIKWPNGFVCRPLLPYFNQAKRWIRETFHGLGQRHLQVYFDEFCFRINAV
jgi:hypothetical protein